MIHMRGSLLRVVATPASLYSATATNPRFFVTLLNSSATASCTSSLSRPQRSAVILSTLRRTYATGEDAKESLQNAAGTVKEKAQDTRQAAEKKAHEVAGAVGANDVASASQGSAETMADAARDTMASAGDRMRDGVGRVGDALSRAADRNPSASSAQGSPIRNEATRTPASEGGTSTNLYIGNLYFEVTGPSLQKEFERFGNVKSAKVITDARGLSKGFGYVEFDDESGATAARNALDGQVLEGRRLVVQYAIRSQPTRRSPTDNDKFVNAPAKTLFIGNLSYEMSDKDLNDLFREIKNVLDVRVAIDRRTGQPRGFAHADFIDVKSAEAAAEFLKTKEYYGRKLRVDFAANSAAR